MLTHIPEKVSLLIGDFRQICAIVDIVPHEMEKRIIARHGMVKLDSLLKRVPELKNIAKRAGADVRDLELLIKRLRNDFENSVMETVRDAMAAHSLKLTLPMLVDSWFVMNSTIFAVLLADLNQIDAELCRILPSYKAARQPVTDGRWEGIWRRELGDPARPRYASIYPGLATAGIVSIVPGGHPAQDVTIRAVSIATFLRQVRIMAAIPGKDEDLDRIFCEILLNDYISLWEQLFNSNIPNEHGQQDVSVLVHWKHDKWKGKKLLLELSRQPHRNLLLWKQKRNTVSAHLDPRIDVSEVSLNRWPMFTAELMNEALRVIEAFRSAANLDVRGKAIFIPPSEFPPEVIGLAAQEGRRWTD